MRQHRFAIAAALMGSTAAVFALSVHAQEAARTVTTATIASEVELNDNYDLRSDSLGNAAVWTTTVGAGLRSRTRVDTLSFDVSGDARVADLPVIGTDTALDNPTLGFAYDRTVDDSTVSVFARGQRADIEFFDPLSDVDDDGNFDDTTGGGTRTSLRTGVNFEVNGDGPISLSGTGRLNDISFNDTTDPDLEDRRDARIGAEIGFALSPILRLTTGASFARADIDDDQQTERETSRADVGFVGQINQRTRLRVRLGYSEVETDRISGTETEDGIVGDVSLDIDEQRGATRLSFGSTVDENGERYSLSYGKSVQWDNAALDTNVGLSTNADTDARFIGNVAYRLTGRDTRLTLSASQTAGTDDDGRDVVNTGGSVQLQRDLSRTATIGLTLNGGLTRIENADDGDSERLTASAQYRHALTEDWSADVGYRYRYRKSEGEESAYSNAVFFGVTRQFRASR